MNLPIRFETDRLIGRCPRIEDASEIFEAYAKDPEITRYMIWRPYEKENELSVWLDEVISSFGTMAVNVVVR